MKVIKLKYENKDKAIADLLSKGVYVETTNEDNETSLSYAEGVHAIVELGLIVLTNGTYDEQGVELTAPVYVDGYHYDVLTDNEITFENEVQVNNPKHTFFGM